MVKPNICLSLGDLSFDTINVLLKEVNMAEIRIDLLNLMPEELNELFAKHKNLIATCRPGRFDEEERAILLERALVHGAAYIDLEIETLPEWRAPLIKLAADLNRKVIVSYHDFDGTPGDEDLDRIVGSLWDAGAHVAKVACMALTMADSARIMNLYSKHSNLVAIAMGKFGTITRVAAPMLGAPFTFASVKGKITAPGQLDYQTLEEAIRIIEPKVNE